MGMAPMTMSPIAGWLISHHDWRTALLIIAAIAAVIMIPTSFCGYRRNPDRIDIQALPGLCISSAGQI
jgi:predicted MFS family arabinose efflux permease